MARQVLGLSNIDGVGSVTRYLVAVFRPIPARPPATPTIPHLLIADLIGRLISPGRTAVVVLGDAAEADRDAAPGHRDPAGGTGGDTALLGLERYVPAAGTGTGSDPGA